MIHLEILSFKHFPILKKMLTEYPRWTCDYNISNLYTWGEYYNISITEFKERLVIYNPVFQYVFFPIGPLLTPFELKELVLLFKKEVHPNSEIILIPECYETKYPEVKELFEITPSENWSDYIYSAEKLVHLSGKKLAKKKNLISQFKRLYPNYEVKRLEASDKEIINGLMSHWKTQRELDSDYLKIEFYAIENTFKYWEEIESKGLIIFVDKNPVAFSIFSPQNEETVTVHFEKFDPEIKGSAQIINYETALFVSEKYQFINREQDMGLEGLRQAKKSYEPECMVKFIYTTLLKTTGE